MESRKKNRNQEIRNEIPDIHIIDLEGDPESPDADSTQLPPESGSKQKTKGRGFLSHVTLHVILLIVALVFVGCLVYKVLNFGQLVDLDEIFKDGPGTYEDTLDTILPLFGPDGNPVYKEYGQGDTILVFGNAPFADDRSSDDNLANMLHDMTGATVYNCSVSGSYLAAEQLNLDASTAPSDIFSFYWLVSLATGFHDYTDAEFKKGLELLGDSAPPEAMEVYNTLTGLDLSTVDVVVVMYDGSDYLAGHPMYNDEDYTDITQFTGSTEAGIELLQVCYPNIRIIVMSPPYAFAVEDDGSYVSSDIKRYGWDVLSTYVIKQYTSCSSKSVTYVDNLYGTINEDNATEYLKDNLHLNPAGRKKIAERLVYALNYYGNPEHQAPVAEE